MSLGVHFLQKYELCMKLSYIISLGIYCITCTLDRGAIFDLRPNFYCVYFYLLVPYSLIQIMHVP